MATEKNIKINVDTKGAVKETEKLAKGLDNAGDEAKKTQAEISTLTGSAGARFKGIIASIKSVALGFRSIGFAIAASGIGLVLLTITAVTAAFKNSEEGQDKFAKLMHRIGTVTGTVVDLLADFGNFIIDLFSGEGSAMKSLKEFGKSLYDLVGLPIKNTIDTVTALGKAIGSLWDGDIEQAFEDLKKGVSDVKQNFTEAATVVENTRKAIKKFTLELSEEDIISQRISDNRAKATKLERALLVDRANAERDIAQFRVDARDAENKTVSERINALNSVLALQVKLADQEVEILKIRRDAIIAENNLAGSKGADLDAEAQANAAVIQAETNRLNASRLILQERLTLQKQFLADRLKLNEPVADGLTPEDAQEFNSKKLLNKKLEGLSIERRVSEEEAAKIEIQYRQDVKNASLQLASSTIGAIGSLAKEGSFLAKGVAVAQATMNTFQGVTKALAETTDPTPTQSLRFGNAIAVGVVGLANVAKILATKPVETGTPSIGGGGGGGRTPQAPAFNLVQGSASNQIANSLQRGNEPLKAYVTSKDMTSEQELNRNIQGGATL